MVSSMLWPIYPKERAPDSPWNKRIGAHQNPSGRMVAGPGKEPVAGSCDHSNEHFGSINGK
jgi:hypothetical protein